MLPLKQCSRAAQQRMVLAHAGYGGDSGSRLILPGQPQRRSGGGTPKLIIPGQQRQAPPQMPPGQANFPELAQQGDMGQITTAAPRNFRPPPGFMNDGGPAQNPFDGQSSDQMLSTLTTRSDKWYNLALAFPRLYSEGYERGTLEEIINVPPARQEMWAVAGAVFHSLQASGELSKEQLAFFKSEEYGPDCLMELRFLDAERRVEGARYIADEQLEPRESVVLGRAIKERQRRPETAEGFSEAAGDCLAFKYLRDAEETRNKQERLQYVEKGLRVAVTEGARERLEVLREEDAEASVARESVANVEIVRLQRDEVGSRIVPLAGVYAEASAVDVASIPSLGGNGAFHAVTLPAGGSEVVVLPRWNIIALAQRPVALSVKDVSAVPEITPPSSSRSGKDALKNRGQGLIVADAGSTRVQPESYYLADVDGRAMLVAGDHVTGAVLGRVMLVLMPPRPLGQVPEPMDV